MRILLDFARRANGTGARLFARVAMLDREDNQGTEPAALSVCYWPSPLLKYSGPLHGSVGGVSSA